MVGTMVTTLSDEGIDDDDLRDMQPQRQNDHWSCGSMGRPSSPSRGNSRDARWDFQEDASLHEFSSAQPRNDQLPETVPIPSQLEMHNGAIKTTEKSNYLDISETCSTARRSTPCVGSDLDHPWDFIHERSEVSHLSASDADEPAAPAVEQPDKASRSAGAPQTTNPEQQKKKAYNTRSRANISYMDGLSSSDEDAPDAAASPDKAPRPPAQKTAKKASPIKVSGPNPTKSISPKDNQPAARAESESPQTGERRKKRQRRKTPLPIDEETQTVQAKLPATPPVSEQRPKKRLKRQPRRLLTLEKSQPRTKNKKQKNASPVPILVATSPELGSEQPAQEPQSPSSENGRSPSHSHDYVAVVDRDDEEDDGSSMSDSTLSTELTTPSAIPSLRRVSSFQIPVVQPPQPLPLPPPSPSVFKQVRDSIELIPSTRPPFISELSTVMSRNASKRDEDIGQRLEEIHKRVGLYLEDKEKEVGAVRSVYLKNGTRCVDRLRNRFSKERNNLLQKLHEDRDTFNTSLAAAKRSLREGARDRQRVLKELDRNANKRQQSCSNEVIRIKEIAKRIQIRG
ncbi:hypothetical protein A9K55_005447 [Cordyceps militaris]|uniref:Uncharacterized protein n=1 Tax=Cordyceps militaris TaxID=73501 RepID=A0A2H4S9M6_CORMI|nr:hypothetical protein A9K55_005447 [Cordyceps militaris]